MPLDNRDREQISEAVFDGVTRVSGLIAFCLFLGWLFWSGAIINIALFGLVALKWVAELTVVKWLVSAFVILGGVMWIWGIVAHFRERYRRPQRGMWDEFRRQRDE
jgi:hypothetical protein